MPKEPKNTGRTKQEIISQIAQYKERIKYLEAVLDFWDEPLDNTDYFTFDENSKLTREAVRQFMRQAHRAVQTVEVVDILYKNISKEAKDKAVKTLSVIFNTLAKDGEIKVEKKEGIKGNFYRWKTDDSYLDMAIAMM